MSQQTDSPDVIDFLAYCRERGFRVRAKGENLIVTPGSKLPAEDADWIRTNKAALLAAVRALGPGPCPGVCPGPAHDACCGGPDPQIELLFPGGLIAPQWCSAGADGGATHWRHRGEREWLPIVRAKKAEGKNGSANP